MTDWNKESSTGLALAAQTLQDFGVQLENIIRCNDSSLSGWKRADIHSSQSSSASSQGVRYWQVKDQYWREAVVQMLDNSHTQIHNGNCVTVWVHVHEAKVQLLSGWTVADSCVSPSGAGASRRCVRERQRHLRLEVTESWSTGFKTKPQACTQTISSGQDEGHADHLQQKTLWGRVCQIKDFHYEKCWKAI